MYEREENAQFSLISYSKERRFRVFQTLPDSWKNKKLLQVLTWFLKLGYYRDYLGNIWRNSKIHDCQPILENYRHWLLKLHQYFPAKYDSFLIVNSLLFQRVILTLFEYLFCLYSFPHIEAIFQLSNAPCRRTQHCWPTTPNIVGTSLHIAKSFTDFKPCATAPNNSQQHATGCENKRNM